MKKIHYGFLMLFLIAILNSPLHAQISNYSFSQQTGQTYFGITGGTVLTQGMDADDDYYSALPIGFTFTYNGLDYTSFGACTNGFVGMGSEVLSAYYFNILGAISTGKVISAFGEDLYKVATSELMYKTEGTAPNRVLTIQYKNFTMFADNSPILNFQIKLYETTNQIKLCYGAMSQISSAYSPQVGLTGSSNADLMCRTTTSSWTATTGSSSMASCTFSATVFPPNGLIFIFSSIPVTVATSATAISATGFTANWGSVADVTSYLLEVSADNFATQITDSPFTITAPSINKAISGLSAGTVYKYRIKVFNTKGSGEFSNVVSVTTAPAAPIASAATGITSAGFTSNWSAVTGATSYSLAVSKDNFTSQIINSPFTVADPTVTKLITGLTSGTAYQYKLKAVNSGGSSDYSNIIDVTTFVPPVITSFAALSAAAGTTVTITGTDLTGTTLVNFGGTPAASFSVVSATSITAVVGAGATGNVSVTTPGGTATKAGFTFIPAPAIGSFSPTTATTGQTVMISGTGFTGATAVTIGGAAPLSYTVVSSTSISAIIANGTSGDVSVTSLGGTGSKAGFTFNPCLEISAPADITVNIASGATGAVVNYTTPVGTNPCGNSQNYGYTGAAQTYVVPVGIYSVDYNLSGGCGGSGLFPIPGQNGSYYDTPGGRGGNITGKLAVNPGDVINVFVGNAGSSPHYGTGGGSFNGAGDLGANQVNLSYIGGGGGGATDLRMGGIALSNRVVVAGAGGGGGAGSSSTAGGAGGGLTAGTGLGNNGGGGGSQVAGGASGETNPIYGVIAGSLLNGGNGGNRGGANGSGGGGGGGGYYGGGGGYWSGGGGGSNYPTAGTQGANSGSGYATIGYTLGGVPSTTRTAGLASGSNFPVGTTTVTYTANDGLGNSKSATFKVTVNVIPTLTDFTPVISSNGQTVTITGTDFTGVTAVSFGGIPATSFSVISPTTITAVVASGASGSVNVTTPGGTATKTGFTWAILPTPTISSVSVPADGTYKPAEQLDFTVNFNENVFVDTVGGTPYFSIILNSGTVRASYISGSGTTSLIFRYTVAPGDLDANGILVGSAIVANGGTMRSNLGQNASLVLNGVGSTIHVNVDGLAPTALFSFGSNALKIGESTIVTIAFSEAVTGFSIANLTVPNGTLNSVISTDGGITWTGTLTPSVNVESAVNQITLDYSGVTDQFGNSSAGTAQSSNFSIDTKIPFVTLVPAATAGGDAFVNASERASGFRVVAQSSEATGRLYVVPASTADNLAAITAASIGSAVSAGANANTTISISASNGGVTDGTSYKVYAIDAAGNISLLSDIAFTADLSGPFAPEIVSPVNGFSSNDNTPSISGTAEVNSTVTLFVDGVANGTTTADAAGNWFYAPAVALNDGPHAVRAICADSAGNISSSSGTINITVDTTPPTVSSVTVPANGTFTSGQSLDFTVSFSEAVLVSNGTPYLSLTIGGHTVHASYLSGSGTSNLIFRYTTTPGDLDTDGIAVGTSIGSNGGIIRDVAGNSSSMTLNSVGNTSGVKVDAIATPTLQAAEVVFSGVQSYRMTIDWTNGDGSMRVVFLKAADAGLATPGNNITYTPDASFSKGSLVGTGWYCIYNGSGTNVTVTDLLQGTNYVAEVFEYNGPAGSEKYLTSTSVNNPKSQATLPCVNPTSGGTIAADQIGCIPFDPQTITSTLLPAGYIGTLEYKWQISTVSSSTGFNDLSNSNSAALDPTAISVTCWYKRLARVSCRNDWSGAAESNVVKMTVNPTSVGGVVSGGSSPIVYGEVTGNLTLTGETGTVVKWQKRVNSGTWSDIVSTAITYSEIPTSAGTWQYRAQVKSGTCSESFSDPMVIVVSRKTLTIAANNLSKIYDGEVNDQFTVSYIGFIPGESPSVLNGILVFNGEASTAVNVGTNYEIIPIGLTADNYNLLFVTGNLTIMKRDLTITATGPFKEYGTALVAGQSAANFKVSNNGVNKEVVSSVTLTPDAAGLTAALAAGGTYKVTPSMAKGSGGFKESNYNITYVPYFGTVHKRSLQISANNQSKRYGAGMPALTYRYMNLADWDSAPAIPPSAKTNATELSPVGSYPITVSGADDPNYDISYLSGILTVNKADVRVVAESKSKIYGSSDPELTYTFSPALFGKDLFSGSLSRTSGENTGSYAINTGTLSAGLNYNLVLTSQNLTILSKQLAVANTVATTSKIYDSSTNASVIPGVLLGLIPGDDKNVIISAVANYSDRYVGKGKTINVTYSLSGSASGNYIKPAVSVVPNCEILAKPLTVLNTIVTTNKMVDGNTSAKIESVGTLTGVEAIDQSSLSISAVANYNDANAGASKSITIVYALSGGSVANYLVPANLLITGAKISEKVVIINAVLSTTAGCEGANLDLTYTVLSGSPVQFQIVFGAASLAQGFKNMAYNNLPSSGNSGTVTIPVPPKTPYGNYQASIQFRNELGVESDLYSFQFVVNVPADYIVAKFDDVILCNNESNSFTSFQWYKNGKAIDGATRQYYSDPDGLVGAYSVQLHRTNGSEFNTCPKVLNIPLKKKVTVGVYPNPVKVNLTSIVKISGLSDEELQGAVMEIYNIQGMKVYSNVKVEQLNSLNLQNQDGVYMGHILTTNGGDYLFRILLVQ